MDQTYASVDEPAYDQRTMPSYKDAPSFKVPGRGASRTAHAGQAAAVDSTYDEPDFGDGGLQEAIDSTYDAPQDVLGGGGGGGDTYAEPDEAMYGITSDYVPTGPAYADDNADEQPPPRPPPMGPKPAAAAAGNDLYDEVPSWLKDGIGQVGEGAYDARTLPTFKGDLSYEDQAAQAGVMSATAATATAFKLTEEYRVIEGEPAAAEHEPTCLMKVYVSKRDYQATDDDELSFAAGENVLVAREDEDGWWLAIREATGEVGYVPNTFLGAEPVHEYRQAVPPELVGLDADGEEGEDEDDGEWEDVDDDDDEAEATAAAASPPAPPAPRMGGAGSAPAPPPLPPSDRKPAVVPRGGGSGGGVPAAPPRPSVKGMSTYTAPVPSVLMSSLNSELAAGMGKLRPAATSPITSSGAATGPPAPDDIAAQVLSVKLRPSTRKPTDGSSTAVVAPVEQHDFRSALKPAAAAMHGSSGNNGDGSGAAENVDAFPPPPPPDDGHSFFAPAAGGAGADMPPPPPDLDLDGGVDEDFVPPPPPPDLTEHGVGTESGGPAAAAAAAARPAPRQRKRPPTVKPKGRRLSLGVLQGLGLHANAKSVKVPTGRKRAPTVKPKRKKAPPPVVTKKKPPVPGQKPNSPPPQKPAVAKKPPPPAAAPKPTSAAKPKPSIRQKPPPSPRLKPKPSVRPRSTASPSSASDTPPPPAADYTNA